MSLEDRVGKCCVSTCSCEAYAFERRMDGFATCVCAHTQWGHEKQ